MEFELYLDESGNNHADWFNNEQPYFVYGGWLIDASKKSDIEKYVNEYISKKKCKELKSKNLFKKSINKNSKNYKEFMEIFKEFIYNFNAIPFLHISNKKFLISALIVDTLFDPKYNSSINNHMYKSYQYNTSQIKNALASYIYENDDKNIIEDYSELIKNNYIDINKMISIKDKLIKLFFPKLPIVSTALSNIKKNDLDYLIKEFTEYKKIKFINSIIVPAIYNLIMNVISLLDKSNNHNTISIYYDYLKYYEDCFNSIKNDIFVKKPYKEQIDKDTAFYYGSDKLKLNKMIAVDSEKEVIIQISDLLCGFTSRTYQDTFKYKEMHKDAIDFWGFLYDNLKRKIPCIGINEDYENSYIFNNIFLTKNMNCLQFIINKSILTVKYKKNNPINIIKKRFKYFLN